MSYFLSAPLLCGFWFREMKELNASNAEQRFKKNKKGKALQKTSFLHDDDDDYDPRIAGELHDRVRAKRTKGATSLG